MNDTPLFTLIIPTYNRPTYLRQAVQSVIDQTYTSWELLIIDDGSEPPVKPLLEDIEDPRIAYYYHANQGLGASRQVGVRKSRGKLLCYLDDDDYLLPTHLEVVAADFHRNEQRECLYKTGMITQTADGALTEGPIFDNGRSALLQHWENPIGIFPYVIPASLARRVPSINFFLSEDFNWLGRLMTEVPVRQLPFYTVVFRLHDQNRTYVLRDRSALRSRLEAVRDLYERPGVRGVIPSRLYRRVMSHQCWHWTRLCLRAHAYGEAGWGFAQGLRTFTPSGTKELLYTIYVFLRTLRK
ncbi:glycosyltransferase family A protein [Lewinella sp. JB7]|uniref:glycosyltransferase family A protein n=1 Tax=Lewinella sp. JB7 TaxID=2962887 RepID=UPI0020C9830C|nr:glycosyltransferase family A protein [Lewinella sp. JB7]MCP9237285.1 glycosyltransferase family 2 protein [Lewinella sp. JB7]